MIPHAKLILSILTIVIIISTTAIGWALTTYQPNRQPTPNPSTNSPQPTLTPTSSSSPSLPPPSVLPTETMPSNSVPVLTATPELSQTPSLTMLPTSAPAQSPTPLLPQGNPTSNGLELTVSLVKSIYNLGEPVNVTLTIKNVSNQTINFTHTGMDFDFLVYDGKGSIAYQWSLGRAFAMFVTILPLLPGGSLSENDVWPQASNTMSPNAVSVSPGTFFIVGESNQRYGLQTAPIQVTILSS